MATISNRLTSTGNLLVNGTIDEFTGAPVIDANVVLWLDAAQTASYSGSGTTWTDLSTTGLNGTLVNSPTYSSNPGNILFNGLNQRVDFANSAAVQFLGTKPYTLEAWVYPTQIPPGLTYQGIIVREGDVGSGRDGYFFLLQGDPANPTTMSISSERWSNGVYGGVGTTVTASSTLQIWQNLTTTYDGSTVKIYRNGVQLTSASSTSNINNNSTTLTIASRSGGSYLYASISGAKIYNRALTAAEVLQNYNALAPRYGLTANTAGNTISRTTANTILSSQFDEVTYNPNLPATAVKNNFVQSQNLATVNWAKTGSVVTANVTAAPDGTITASKLVGNSGITGRKSVYQYVTVTANTYYTYSVYLKKAEFDSATIWFDTVGTLPSAYMGSGSLVNLTLGTVSGTQTTISNVGNGWYRCAVTASSNVSLVPFQISQGDPNGVGTPIGDGTSGIYIWGAQLETGNTATIYQPIAAANTLVASTTVRKIDKGANYYIQGQFDELTGAPVIDGNLKFWIDAAQSNSYSGSGATWYDISTSQSNVTLYNSPTYSSSVTGGNIKFTPASTQYGDTATNLGNMPKWTAEAWVKVNASLTGQVTSAVTNQYNLSNALNYSIGTNKAPTDYNLCVGFFDGAWHNTTGFVPTLDTWYQVVGTYDGTALTQYVNGTANGSAVSYTGTASSGGNTRIARRWDDTTVSTNLFPGDIAVVRIYNRALTADEVSQNFNAHRRRFNI